MHLRLRDGLHFCKCAERIIFLDVHTDRYFALSGQVDLAFQAWIAGEVSTQEPGGHLNSLIGTGLLVPAPGEAKIGESSSLEPAKRDFYARVVGRVGVTGAKAFLLRYRARRSMRTQSFRAVLRDVSDRKAALTSITNDAVGEISLACKAFGSTSWAFRARDQCVPESIAFHRLCLDRGVPATLVIGVKVNPFAAHCWVQHGDVVINDRMERIRQFTPILEI